MLKFAKTLLVTYFAQLVCVVANILLIPIYSKNISSKIIGLIGIIGMLSTWTGLIESAVASVVTREIAKSISSCDEKRQMSDLFKSMLFFVILLFIFVFVVLVVGLKVVISSDFLFHKNDIDAISGCVFLFSLLIALRLIEIFYKSVLIGLGLNTLMNVVIIITTCVRSLLVVVMGSLGIISINGFFVIQVIFGALLVGIYASVVYQKLPGQYFGISRTLSPINGLWRFSSGIMVHNLLVVTVGQLDKLIAIRFTSLIEFGYYSLAASCANLITMIVSPISQIYYPRISQISLTYDKSSMTMVINQAALTVVALAGTAACVAVVYCESYFKLWLGAMSDKSTIVVVFRIVVVANLISGFLWIPNIVQFSNNNTVTSIKTYLWSLPIQIIALWFLVPRYGGVGCAISLLICNLFTALLYWFKFNNEVLRLDFGGYIFKRHVIPIFKMVLIVIVTKQVNSFFSNLLLDFVFSLIAAIICLAIAVPIKSIKLFVNNKSQA